VDKGGCQRPFEVDSIAANAQAMAGVPLTRDVPAIGVGASPHGRAFMHGPLSWPVESGDGRDEYDLLCSFDAAPEQQQVPLPSQLAHRQECR
jgi:hypothetical protein